MIDRRPSPKPRKRPCVPVLFLVVCCSGTAVSADEPASNQSAAPPIFSTTGSAATVGSTTSPPPARRLESSGVSARVRSLIEAKLPPFVPPLPANEADNSSDAVKLPPVLVTAPRLKVPDSEQVLSRDAFAARLRKLYPGASTAGQDPYRVEHGVPNYARLEYEYEKHNAQKASIDSFADLLEHTGDRKQAKELRKQVQRASSGATYKDPLLEAMDKSANGGRR